MLKNPLLITLIWAIFILIICLIPGDNIKNINPINIPYLDKLIHFFMYMVLSVLLVSSIRRSSFFSKNPNLSYLLIVLLAIIYGGSIELLQRLEIFSRNSDIIDFMANTAGVISGLFIYFVLKKIITKILRKA